MKENVKLARYTNPTPVQVSNRKDRIIKKCVDGVSLY